MIVIISGGIKCSHSIPLSAVRSVRIAIKGFSAAAGFITNSIDSVKKCPEHEKALQFDSLFFGLSVVICTPAKLVKPFVNYLPYPGA